jgi:uncharacterized protein YutE (UPF0331/DUF86 family)
MSRIKDKIEEIEKFLTEFKEFIPSSFDEYTRDLKGKAACERYLEKVIEALVDLAFIIIKIKKMKIPQDDIDAFNILLEKKIIDEVLAKKLQDAKGMRNILAHEYGKVDDKLVFEAIKTEIIDDANMFIKEVKELDV